MFYTRVVKLLLLVVIYIVFISLGLPDGVLGSAWPAIHTSLSAPVALGGLLTVVSVIMTTTSSLMTTRAVRKIGIGWLVTISVLLTSVALLGLSWADRITLVFLFAIPLGLGAGAIDSALNHYVAHNYKAHHMNWLHAFWGVGAMLGPLAFAAAFGFRGDWHAGFLVLGAVQMAIVILLLTSLKLWSNNKPTVEAHTETPRSDASIIRVLSGRTVQLSAFAFLLYVGLEVVIGFWLASYLVAMQQFDVRSAAVATSLYYGAIMVGRLMTGFLSFRLSGAVLIRLGMCMSLVGAVLLGMSISGAVSVAGAILIGLGFAPVYPNLIHATPERFAGESSQVMSIQMAAGYLGAAIFAPLVGLLESRFSTLAVFIWVVLAAILIFFALSEWLNRRAYVK